jgi:uncharacterized protein YcsI (UPF0317 family)
MNTHPATVTASDLEGARWITSSYSNNGGNCVEVAGLSSGIGIRDSKNPTGPALLIAPGSFATFVSAVRGGHYGT